MATRAEVRDFLNDLLMTDRQNLAFLDRLVRERHEPASLEQVVDDLTKLALTGSSQTPAGLMRWIRAPATLGARSLSAAITMAGLIGGRDLGEPLMNLLRQLTYVAAHPAAVRALAQTTGAQAPEVLTTLLWKAPPQHWHVREPAILLELGRLRRKSTIPDLIKALAVSYDAPAGAAARALASFDPDDVFSSLLPLLSADKKGTVDRRTAGAAEALGLLGDPRALPGLRRTVVSSDARVAIKSAAAMARLGSPEAEEWLLKLASNDNVNVRASALGSLALVQFRDEPSAVRCQTVLRRALRDPQPEVRGASARTLGELGLAAASRSIAESLATEVSPLVRAEMILSLGRLAHPLSVPALLAQLEGGDPTTKVQVLGALALFGDPAMAKHISPYRLSPHPSVVTAALEALTRLLHKEFEWPDPVEVEDEIQIDLYDLVGARERLLPPALPQAVGFFSRIFGARPAPPPPEPQPTGTLRLTPTGVEVRMTGGVAGGGRIRWDQRFAVQITRDVIEEASSDIGVHFVLRQRRGHSATDYDTVGVTLWCAPSAEVGRFPAKSERLPCLDPHRAEPFLAALRWYAELYGETIQGMA